MSATLATWGRGDQAGMKFEADGCMLNYNLPGQPPTEHDWVMTQAEITDLQPMDGAIKIITLFRGSVWLLTGNSRETMALYQMPDVPEFLAPKGAGE